MIVAIIGGGSDDEAHLARIAAKSGDQLEFYRLTQQALSDSVDGSASSASVRPATALASSAPANGEESSAPPRALVFEALDRPDIAIRALRAVRRDPYFDEVGALVALNPEQAAKSELPGGFDDFLLSPYPRQELAIRVRALAERRSARSRRHAAREGAVVMDETSRDVYVDGRPVQLTAREFALFSYLCEWRGKVLSREHLLARVWGSRYLGGRRTVDIHVRRLRAKLGASLSIETLRGSGYRLRREPNEGAPDGNQIPDPFSKVS